jgi:AraC-like DNA-binding protein
VRQRAQAGISTGRRASERNGGSTKRSSRPSRRAGLIRSRSNATLHQLRHGADGSVACGATYSSVAQTLTRSPRIIANRPADVFAIGIQVAGNGFGSQDGRDSVFQPGDLVLYDMIRPFRMTFRNNFVRTTVLFPRSALLSRVGPAEQFVGRSIDGTTGVGAILSPMLQNLSSSIAGISTVTRERVAENLLDLIASALLSSYEPAPLSAGMTLTRIKLWIETHLGEKLSAENIASQFRLSARHVNRLFEREGTSSMHHVWQRRLTRCHQDLTDPAMRHRSISDIAFAAGFNDLSHFSRVYRARYGCAPRDTRSAG